MSESGGRLSRERIDRLAAMFAREQWNELIEQGRGLLAEFPREAFLHNLMAAAYYSLHRYPEAVVRCLTALQIQPDYADARDNLRVMLTALGLEQQAIDGFDKAWQSSPDVTQALHDLAITLARLGRDEDALGCYRILIESGVEDEDTYSRMARAQLRLGRFDEALAVTAKLLRTWPETAEAHNDHGTALFGLGRYDQALHSFNEAARLRQDFAQAFHNLGVVLVILGREEEAIANYRRAIRIDPGYTGAHCNLSEIKRYEPGDSHFAQMAELFASSKLADHDKLLLGFALGKACDDMQRYDQAFDYLLAANRMRKRELAYSIDQDIAVFQRIKSIFAAMRSHPEGPSRFPKAQQRPVFILGMPRSGTSLVEQILACHSRVHAAGELETMNQGVIGIVGDEADVGPEHIERLRAYYLDALERLGAGKPVVTDKMPLNFKWIGFILEALPEARIIHVKRDARAVCWSIFKTCFMHNGNGYAYDMRDVAEYYGMYADLMRFWEARYPRRIHHLGYEALTEAQEAQTRKLLDCCGLAWEAQCLDFHASGRVIATASKRQVTRKMYQGSSDAWRRYEKHLQPMLRILESRLSNVSAIEA